MKVSAAEINAPYTRKKIKNETEGKGKNRSQRVVIHYRFIGILDYPQTEPAYTADTRKGVAVKYVTKSA